MQKKEVFNSGLGIRAVTGGMVSKVDSSDNVCKCVTYTWQLPLQTTHSSDCSLFRCSCTTVPFRSLGPPHLSIASAYLPPGISTVFAYLTWGTWVLNCLFLYGTERLHPIGEFLVFGRLSVIDVVVDDDDDA